MNIKMEEQDLRFKITKNELKTLLMGQCLHTKISVFDRILIITINPKECGELMEVKLVTDDENMYLLLFISPKNIQKLSDMMPNPDGLKQKIDEVSITLQVNMPEICHT